MHGTLERVTSRLLQGKSGKKTTVNSEKSSSVVNSQQVNGVVNSQPVNAAGKEDIRKLRRGSTASAQDLQPRRTRSESANSATKEFLKTLGHLKRFLSPSRKSGIHTTSKPAAITVTSEVFSTDLVVLMKHQGNGSEIPKFLQQCFNFLRNTALATEGLFRIGGVKNEIMKLRISLDLGEQLVFENIDNVHNLTGLIKLFFRELPAPILTYKLYNDLLLIADLPEEERSTKLKDILLLLPKENSSILAELMALLYQVSCHCNVNLMDANNLSIVMGPNLMWEETRSISCAFASLHQITSVITTMIERCCFLFPAMAEKYHLLQLTKSDAVLCAQKRQSIKQMLQAGDESLGEAKHIFEMYDADGSGELDMDEFWDFFRDLLISADLPPPSEAQFGQFLSLLDTDGNGNIDWNEFKVFWSKLRQSGNNLTTYLEKTT